MYGYRDRNEGSGEVRRFPRRHRVLQSTPVRRNLPADRSGKLMAALRNAARTLSPDVVEPWLGLNPNPGLGGRLIGACGRSGQETLDATSILILIIVVAHDKPVTFFEIEHWLPDWARCRRDALGELLAADLLVIEPITSREPARFSVSAAGRTVALTEAVHLLLSIG